MSPNHEHKKSVSVGFIAAIVLGAGVTMILLNYWHAMKCVESKGLGDMNDYVEILEKRILQLESNVIKNNLLTESVINSLQKRLVALDAAEMKQLAEHSKDEAVRIALMLAAQGAPPMPQFVFESSLRDAENLANFIDDAFQQENSVPEEFGEVSYAEAREAYAAQHEEGATLEKLSDEEAEKMCLDWKSFYDVKVGVSWGNLPYDLQSKWRAYGCDYLLS